MIPLGFSSFFKEMIADGVTVGIRQCINTLQFSELLLNKNKKNKSLIHLCLPELLAARNETLLC